MHRNNPKTEFAQAVRAARDAAGLTQAALAMCIAVAPSTIYRVERGVAPGPEVEAKLRRWAKTLPALTRAEAA